MEHEIDFYELLRSSAQLIREGRFAELDAETLADELEAMSNSQRRELRSRLRQLIMHLLKWQYQPGRRSQTWIHSIINQRREIQDVLKDSPSLKPALSEISREVWKDAREDAAKETGLSIKIIPVECPYTLEQVLDGDFMPE